MCCADEQHVAGNKQHVSRQRVACCRQHVACISVMYPFVSSNRRATNWQQFCCRQHVACCRQHVAGQPGVNAALEFALHDVNLVRHFKYIVGWAHTQSELVGPGVTHGEMRWIYCSSDGQEHSRRFAGKHGYRLEIYIQPVLHTRNAIRAESDRSAILTS